MYDRVCGCIIFLSLIVFVFLDGLYIDEYTPFYGLICYVWAVLLYRFWERKENTLAYEWGTFEVASDGENIAEDFSGGYHHSPRRRPEFKGILRPSPVTGAPELYYPGYKRKFKYLVSAVVTAIMLSIAFYTMILSLNLQGYIRRRVSTNPFYFPQFTNLSEPGAIMDAQSSWRSFIPVVIHALSIMTLNTIYRGIARRLTVWENHETQTAFENSLVLKRFLFEAFDCYIVLLYLAFYARDMERLRAELIAVFNIDSFRRLFTECILPMIFHYFDPVADNEHPQDLHLDEYESFDDYMEILIQFGYVTLFASAYPLASLLACAALWLEIRSDCYKLTYLCQKPAGERVSNIGMWKALLGFMVWFSCLTNCLLFGLTSNQMMHYMPAFYIHDGEGVTHMVQDKGWLVILVIFGLERVLIYFGLALHAAIPSLPEELVVRLRRRNYFRFQQQQRLLQRRKSKKE